MRITPKQYAEGLYEAVQNAKPSERAEILDQFFALLVRERRMREMPAILTVLQRIVERENNEKRVSVRSARALPHEVVRELRGRLTQVFGVQRVDIDQKVDPNLRGGMVIESEDETLDVSIRGTLLQLRKHFQE